MWKFQLYIPTRIVLGRGAEREVGSLIKQENGKKVLVHYGGRSAQRSGLLKRIFESLDEEGIQHVSLGGVVPNPRLSKVYEGIELCKKENVDFILAVGGGSVIDLSLIHICISFSGELCYVQGNRQVPVKRTC